MLKLLFTLLLFYTVAGDAVAQESLNLEREYTTDCVSLYENYKIDDVYIYSTRGRFENNSFEKLNLITGKCESVGSLPTFDFVVKAISEKYIFAQGGIYNRHSLYDKKTGKILNSMRFKNTITDAIIKNEKLYLLKIDASKNPDQRTIAELSLPDFKVLRKIEIPEDNGFFAHHPLDRKVYFWGDNLIFALSDRVKFYSVDGIFEREVLFQPISPNETSQISCVSRFERLSTELIFLQQRDCSVSSVVDIKSSKELYNVKLQNDRNFAKAHIVGGNLYVLESAKIESHSHKPIPSHYLEVFDKTSGIKKHSYQFAGMNAEKAYFINDKIVFFIYDNGNWKMQVFNLVY
jgi:hypothetical protein